MSSTRFEPPISTSKRQQTEGRYKRHDVWYKCTDFYGMLLPPTIGLMMVKAVGVFETSPDTFTLLRVVFSKVDTFINTVTWICKHKKCLHLILLLHVINYTKHNF